ncbi:MBL fold metallo-hydrolase [Streptomyces phaeofaciens JCM 4814]|uniref:MBL fold metallo-hydrolase n=1 Tax=Streptomyces phaeofaciens TaxID=68254 RepID=A0A918H460_9ACTN|nr:MBL fold metallo-hydrolase [Streptomyces phaeofaciens]GGT36161.1 MBL fold metallo-hydrolase [Streptomyces phaeofaciens]
MSLPTTTPYDRLRPSVPPPRVEEVADGIHAFVQPDGGWCLSNSGILTGRRSVALVDSAATEARARGLRAAALGLGRGEPRTVLNTHHHGDHTFGNAVAAPGATVVGHELARTEMAERGEALKQVWPDTDWGDLGGIELSLPTVTFTDRLTVYVDDLAVELIHVGPAHTNSDVVVWLPGQRVLFAGDVLMPGCTPYVLAGSVLGSLRAVERLRALAPRVVVGGHGPVAGPGILDETEAYLRWLGRLADEGLAAGLTPYETAREAAAGPYAELRDPERIVANLHRAFSEAQGRPLDTPIRSGPVFAEMTRYNGGRPPTCLA